MTIQYPDFAALVLRIGFGFYMLFGHGIGKLNKLLAGGDIEFISFLGMSPKVCLTLAVVAEFLACILIIIGYKTRLATLPLIITMLVAIFSVHGTDPWFMQGAAGGSKEPAFIYLVGYVSIYLLGSGKYSVDDRTNSVI